MEENERLAIIETKIETMEKKTDKIDFLDSTMLVLSNSMVDVKKAIEKLTEKIDKASEAPIIEKAKNWDSTLKWIFGIVAGIIVGVAGAILTGK